MPGAPAGPWTVRTAGRIGVALATLTALSVAALSIIDQATFVPTTDARVRAHMVTMSAKVAGRLVDGLPAAGDREKQGQVLARRHDRRALAETSLELKALEIEIEREALNADVSRERGGQRSAGRGSRLDLAGPIWRRRRPNWRAPGWERRRRTAGRPTPPPGRPRRCPCRRAMRHATGLLASAAPAATFFSQKGVALLSAPLSALLTQRTAFHGDALLPPVTVSVMDGNLGLRDVSRAVRSTALLLGFRDRFLVTGLARLALIPVGLFVGDRSNFTDRLKRVLTLFR